MNKQLLDESISYYYDYLVRKLATKHSKDECSEALAGAYISMLGKDLKIVNKQHCCSILFKESMFILYRRKDRQIYFEDMDAVEWATNNTAESSTIIKSQLNYIKKNASKNLLTYAELGKYTDAAKALGIHPVTLRQQLYVEMAALRNTLPFKFIHDQSSNFSYYKQEDIDKV